MAEAIAKNLRSFHFFYFSYFFYSSYFSLHHYLKYHQFPFFSWALISKKLLTFKAFMIYFIGCLLLPHWVTRSTIVACLIDRIA